MDDLLMQAFQAQGGATNPYLWKVHLANSQISSFSTGWWLTDEEFLPYDDTHVWFSSSFKGQDSGSHDTDRRCLWPAWSDGFGA